jgi:alpha-L-arabinofuranosidase
VIWLLLNQDVFSLSGPSINAFQLAEKIRPLIEGMRTADPEIKINVRGMPLTSYDDEAAQWNRTLIQQLNGSFDKLSLQSALPGFESWQQPISGSDIGLYVAAAPAALQQVRRNLARAYMSGKSARLAIDDWNFWPAVIPENNQSIFTLPSLTQALYTAAMLNGFSRQPRVIAWAAHSALFGDLGLIQTDGQQAYAAPAAAVFAMQQNMETLALKTSVESPAFQLDAYGNIPALKIPYVGCRRHPLSQRQTGGFKHCQLAPNLTAGSICPPV